MQNICIFSLDFKAKYQADQSTMGCENIGSSKILHLLRYFKCDPPEIVPRNVVEMTRNQINPVKGCRVSHTGKALLNQLIKIFKIFIEWLLTRSIKIPANDPVWNNLYRQTQRKNMGNI